MRVLIVVFIAISVVLAIVQYRSSVTFIAQLMGISWGALAGAFLAPFLFGLYWKRATKAGCWASFLFSVVVMLANMLVGSLFPAVLRSSINCGRLLHAGRAGQSSYFAYSTALVSRSRWTLICPGYSSSSSIFLAMSRASSTIWSSLTSSGLTMMRTSRPAWMA